MAMKTASPFWLSIILGVALLFVFIGERLLTVPSMQVVFTGIGVTAILLVTAARGWAWSSSTGARKRIEGTLLASHLGTVLALFLYTMTTSWGPDFDGPHARSALTVLWVVVLTASVIPVLMIEIALGTALRSNFDVQSGGSEEANVDFLRVRDMGWSGLTIAFALGFLMVTCGVAKERNVARDVSYFKTSMAGESTQNIVNAGVDPLRVYLFFGDGQEAQIYVRNYFEQLASATGKVEIFTPDRRGDAELASKFKVSKDGVIVLARGKDTKEKFFTIDVPEKELKDVDAMRRGTTLRTLDNKVNKELIKLAREKRKAYVITGHGEANDPDSIPAHLKGRLPEHRTSRFKQQLVDRNYEVKEIGLTDLMKDLPEDATIVILMAPTAPLLEGEWATLDRYLNRGGRLLLALDPKAVSSIGPLEQKLGVRAHTGVVNDDKVFYPLTNKILDHQFAVTTQFSAHASTTSLSRTVDKGLLLLEAGALEDIDTTPGQPAPKRTVTLRTMDTSWLDLDGNFTFDGATEKRQRWNLAEAFEGPKLTDGKDGYRVLVYGDVNLFTDFPVPTGRGMPPQIVMVSGPLLRDSIDWLGGEEVFGGEVVSEEDKALDHTKNEESAWFVTTIIGVPFAVFGLGAWGAGLSRRRRSAKTQEVKP
jgi:hypothetical protein